VWFKHNKVLLSKIVALVIILGLSGVMILGCMGGTLPRGWSGGAIAGDTLFLGSMDGKLIAVNLDDGSYRFSESLKGPASAGGFGCVPMGGAGCAAAPTGVAIYGTPAVSGDLVYIGGYNGKVYAFNSSSLGMWWVYPSEGNLESIVGGVVVSQGTVYFGGSDGKVYALDGQTKDPQWDSPFQTGDKIWSTPVIDGDTLYIGSFDKKLYALDVTTGREKWEKPFEAQGAIVSTPVVYDNMVFIGSFDRHIYAVRATSGGQIWQFPETDEEENKPENWFWAQPVIFNNTIYAGNLDGKVYVLNAETGKERVEPIDLGSPISSSPVVVGNLVIFAAENGVIYALDTEDNQISQLADVEDKVYAPLSGGEGVVYVHTQKGILYEVDTQTGALRKLYSSE